MLAQPLNCTNLLGRIRFWGSIETLMPDVLHAALLFTNAKCLYDEVRQMKLAWQYEAINYLNMKVGSVDAM